MVVKKVRHKLSLKKCLMDLRNDELMFLSMDWTMDQHFALVHFIEIDLMMDALNR